MRQIKTKNIGKITAASIVSILFLAGMSGVSACHLDTEIIAGQNWDNPVGNVHISHDSSWNRYMYITYMTSGGWEITETHLAVASSFNDIPQTKSGNPKIGKFPYSSHHDPAVTSVTYVIDLEDYIKPDSSGKYLGTLYIAAHSVVQKLMGYDSHGNPIYAEETGWADTYSQPFPGNSWALWFSIVLG